MNFVELSFLYKCLFLFGSSIIIFSILIAIFVKIFKKFNLLDHPERYPHEKGRKPLAYGFGIIMFLSFAIMSISFLDLGVKKIVFILVLGLILGIFNFIDDLDTIGMTRIKITPFQRLIIQILVGAVIGITSIKIGYISNIFGGIIHLDSYFFNIGIYRIYLVPLFFTIAWYVLVFNAINWSDAIPGMTTGLSFVAMLIIGILTIKLYITDTSYLSKENSEFVLLLLSIVLPMVVLVWLFDRKQFLIGDGGTMFLGFIIATLAVISGGKIATVVAVLGVYIIDAFYVIFARLYNKKNPLKGDMIHHLHFRLRKIGFSDSFIRNLVYILSFFFGLGAIFLDKIGKIIIFSILVIIVVFVTKILSLKNK
ncbi:MAG: MraY family glycosyltransferase [Candidatus Gracilibacteria bacterium]|nr:MraY family glycosyltransferase [Candidatus Gracilibacteria bacterium]